MSSRGGRVLKWMVCLLCRTQLDISASGMGFGSGVARGNQASWNDQPVANAWFIFNDVFRTNNIQIPLCLTQLTFSPHSRISSSSASLHLHFLFKSFFVVRLVRPLVLVQLRVVVRLAVLHCDATWEDGGHVVADGLPLRLLLPLLLHLSQLDTWKGGRKDTVRGDGGLSHI